MECGPFLCGDPKGDRLFVSRSKQVATERRINPDNILVPPPGPLVFPRQCLDFEVYVSHTGEDSPLRLFLRPQSWFGLVRWGFDGKLTPGKLQTAIRGN